MLTTSKKRFFKTWELALLLALCVSMCAGLWAGREQRRLAAGLVRLHVIAASDSTYDQAVKLQVRDAALALLSPALETAATPEEAQEIITELLPALEQTAADTAEKPAAASLNWERYPTRVYEGFSLPAGDYLSLRLEIGPAQGKNWWCVVFPPLCAAAAEDAGELTALLDEGDAALVTGDGEGYVLKFRLMELWAELRDWISR